jgi:hypothetical protein
MAARVLWRNLADSGTVTASSWIASAPPSTLQNVHRNRRWKGRNGPSEYILVDLGSAQSIDFIGLFGCAGIFDDTQRNLSETASRQVRVSTVDSNGEAGDAYDSAAASGFIKEAYGACVTRLATPVTGRYVRIDLFETGADAILAGRLVVGLTSAFTYNFSYGWAFGYSDNSRRKKSAGGQTYVDRDDRFRVLNLTFESLAPGDRYSIVHEIDRNNGLTDDIAFIIDPDSDDLTRDTIWGLMTDLAPPTQPNFAFFSKTYSIEERL